MKVFQHIVKEQEVTCVKPGNVIISQAFWDDEDFNRSVILILQHNDRGTVGLILNRQSNVKVIDVLPDLDFNFDLFYGGSRGINKIGYLHDIEGLSHSIKISDGIYWGGNIYQLKHMITNEEIDPEHVKFFAGLVEWTPGELAEEIKNKQWWMDEFSIDELLYIENNALWAYKLINRENLYGLLFEVPDPCLN